MPLSNEQDQKQIARALLEVYAYRADLNDEHRLAVGSFLLAVASRTLNSRLSEQLDYARCALERAAHGLKRDEECTQALRELAPALVELKICEQCHLWRAHRANCPVYQKEPEPQYAVQHVVMKL